MGKKLDFILLAAGKGKRSNLPNKVLYKFINGKNCLDLNIAKLLGVDFLNLIIVVGNDEVKKYLEDNYSFLINAGLIRFVYGGKERFNSSYNGVKEAKADFVAVHDAARPFYSIDLLKKLYNKAKEIKAVIPVLPTVDTVKVVEDEVVKETLDRKKLFRVQTPQVFDRKILLQAFEKFFESNESIFPTDEAMIVEKFSNNEVYTVIGEESNKKLTYKTDFIDNTNFLKNEIRVGFGIDVHKFNESKPLYLCGVKILDKNGLEGVSDADVALHAICDALLGAVADYDIGYYFPPETTKKGISSLVILDKILEVVKEKGFKPKLVDLTIVAQKPKLAKFREKMIASLEKLLNIKLVSVKFTTTEKLGFLGRSEGMMAMAVVMLENDK